ncbi:type IV pilus twitching motility protein PilT [Chloroflexota bacterium]
MDLVKLLHDAKSLEASDLHMVVGTPPMVRVNGSLSSMNGHEELTATEVNEAFLQITSPEERDHFHTKMELDFGYSIFEVGQFRCNAAMQRGAISLAIRLLPATIPTLEELELPEICKQLIMKPRGLIIVTGPTGSGKTTTLAAMINYLNKNDKRHILTIEDPIEYVHPSINCAITQRELGTDTHSFAEALKHVLRQDPDVILVGEMRDMETAASVLNVAETGHLILSTGHAPSAPQAMERIIDLFPMHERGLAQSRLASLMIASLCQTLVPRADGTGRVAAVEIMLANSAVRNLLREGKTYQLHNTIRTHRDQGMITLDEILVDLYLKNIITGESVVKFCNDRQEVEKLIGKIGV